MGIVFTLFNLGCAYFIWNNPKYPGAEWNAFIPLGMIPFAWLYFLVNDN